jgi:hypothetical protein
VTTSEITDPFTAAAEVARARRDKVAAAIAEWQAWLAEAGTRAHAAAKAGADLGELAAENARRELELRALVEEELPAAEARVRAAEIEELRERRAAAERAAVDAAGELVDRFEEGAEAFLGFARTWAPLAESVERFNAARRAFADFGRDCVVPSPLEPLPASILAFAELLLAAARRDPQVPMGLVDSTGLVRERVPEAPGLAREPVLLFGAEYFAGSARYR